VIKPNGLKRFVEFKALHRVRNLTDQPLELVTYWQNQVCLFFSSIAAPLSPALTTILMKRISRNF